MDEPVPPPELRYRLGCPLALAIAAALVAALDAFAGRRVFEAWEWLAFGAHVGIPFGTLALARVRDWVAWAAALALIAGLCASFVYADPGSTDFLWGFGMMLAPLVIAGLCLCIAGLRGRISWASECERP